MKDRFESFELRYTGFTVEPATEANLYTFNFRLTPTVIVGTMLGDANFKDVTVAVKMPAALAARWGLGKREAQAAFSFAFCMGIGNDLDSDFVDVDEWREHVQCPLQLGDPLPEVGESWLYSASSRTIALFPFLPQEPKGAPRTEGLPRTPDRVQKRPMGKAAKVILVVLGLIVAGIVVNIVGSLFHTDSEGAASITVILIVAALLAHFLNKANTENSMLRAELEERKEKSRQRPAGSP
jgi:hypothetical protein